MTEEERWALEQLDNGHITGIQTSVVKGGFIRKITLGLIRPGARSKDTSRKTKTTVRTWTSTPK